MSSCCIIKIINIKKISNDDELIKECTTFQASE